MKIEIFEPGMDTFTGEYCDIKFVNGVSVGMFSKRDMMRLKACIRARLIKDEPVVEKQPEPEVKIAAKEEPKVEEVVKVEEPTEEPEKEEPEAEPEAEEFVGLYTREELETVADKDGIAGLRELGDKHDIKGRAIAELIEELLAVKKED